MFLFHIDFLCEFLFHSSIFYLNIYTIALFLIETLIHFLFIGLKENSIYIIISHVLFILFFCYFIALYLILILILLFYFLFKFSFCLPIGFKHIFLENNILVGYTPIINCSVIKCL